MTSAERIEQIRKQLAFLKPTLLDIVDTSEQHRGHPGSQSGAGHFSLHIASPALAHHSLLAAHRIIYEALADLLGKEIHALQIRITS